MKATASLELPEMTGERCVRDGVRDEEGVHDNQGCKITVNDYINCQAHAGSVLLHEVIEAIDYRLELKMDHEKITQLEAALIQVIRDNPDLLKELSS